MDIVEHLQQILSEPPTRDGGYDVSPFTILLVYEELDKHVKAGNPPHRYETASTYEYLNKKLTESPIMEVGKWWCSYHQLEDYADEITRLREGRELTPEERIDEALGVLLRYGGFDGAHHKAWVIDQAVRQLVGPKDYPAWVADARDGPDSYEWDEGIAP